MENINGAKERKDGTKHTFLFPIFDTVLLVDSRTEISWVTPKSDLKRGKESVHTGQQRLRTVYTAIR